MVARASHGVRSNAAVGRRMELRSIAILEAAGYVCVRSHRSLGPFDLIAFSAHEVVLCQVKTTHWPGAVEVEQMQLFPCPPNCRKLIHRWVAGRDLPDTKEVSG